MSRVALSPVCVFFICRSRVGLQNYQTLQSFQTLMSIISTFSFGRQTRIIVEHSIYCGTFPLANLESGEAGPSKYVPAAAPGLRLILDHLLPS